MRDLPVMDHVDLHELTGRSEDHNRDLLERDGPPVARLLCYQTDVVAIPEEDVVPFLG